ncbi:FmdE family protein [Thermodesulfovibrio hydrogeniphilus]
MVKKFLLALILIFFASASYALDVLNKIEVILTSELKPVIQSETLIITNAMHVKDEQVNALIPLLLKFTKMENLFLIHDAVNNPLFVFVYDSASDKAVYISVVDNEIKYFVTENFLATSITRNDDELKDLFQGKAMRVLPIIIGWKKGIPFELKNSILFHDHFCPGVTSGYWIAKYLLKNFPLSQGQRYFVISTPPWCKDDAIQTILNTTAGKRNFVVIPISEKSKNCLKDEAKNLAGIYIKYSPQSKSGEAIILEFLWDDLRKSAGVKEGKAFKERLKMIEWMLENDNQFEKFVRVIKNVQLSNVSIDELVDVNINVLKKFDLWKCQ